MRVILIAGGWSEEREVSLAGAKGILPALKNLGHEVVFLDPAEDFARILPEAEKSSFAFIILHGEFGEDGLIQAMLDSVGCPYQGSGPAGSLLALNKAAAKTLFVKNGIPTPGWELLPAPPGPGWKPKIAPPVFVKPNTGGSSVDMSFVRNAADLPAALDLVFNTGRAALIEEYMQGEEVTCAVLDRQALPPILIRPKNAEFFDYKSKYEPGASEEICPAPISEKLTRLVQSLTVRAHRSLGLDGYCRADFIVSEDGNPYILEVNTLPGMTPTSLLPQAAAAAGYTFENLLARLIELGLRRKRLEKQHAANPR